MAKKLSKKSLDAKINSICSKAVQNLQINIMDLSKVYNFASKEYEISSSDEEAVILKTREFVCNNLVNKK